MDEALFGLTQYVFEAGIWGPAVYVFLMVLAIVFSPIPSTPLAIFAGGVFGVWWGFLWTMVGSTLGAIIAFYIARILGRPVVLHLVSPKKVENIEKYIPERHIAVSLFFLRLLPLPLLDGVSYVAGLTKISFSKFLISTIFGIFPLVFLFSYFGRILIDNPVYLLLLTALVFFAFIIAYRIMFSRPNKKTGK